ncbi:MAG: hypothetical protein ACXWB8_10360, partial [Ramlibacter sp.]
GAQYVDSDFTVTPTMEHRHKHGEPVERGLKEGQFRGLARGQGELPSEAGQGYWMAGYSLPR